MRSDSFKGLEKILTGFTNMRPAKRCTSFHVVVMLLDITSGSRTVANATGMFAPVLISSSVCSEHQTVSSIEQQDTCGVCVSLSREQIRSGLRVSKLCESMLDSARDVLGNWWWRKSRRCVGHIRLHTFDPVGDFVIGGRLLAEQIGHQRQRV
jgi:hypothetical protein